MSVLDRVRAAVAGTIAEIEEARRAATQELISFKAGAKLMEARERELEGQLAEWQRRAEQAVLAGDDDLARQALARRAELAAERARVRADRAEQEAIAVDMLRGRRELDRKLADLRLREGSVAANIARGQPGGDPFATQGGAWDRFDDAERAIEDDAALAEVSELDLDPTEVARHKIDQVGDAARADDALAELKRKMQRGE